MIGCRHCEAGSPTLAPGAVLVSNPLLNEETASRRRGATRSDIFKP